MSLKKFLPLIILLSSMCTYADWKPAMINDSDGYTYIRSGAGMEFDTLATIKGGELFYCNDPANDEWIEISYNFKDKGRLKQVQGYMHKSRVLLLEDITTSRQKELLLNIFDERLVIVDNNNPIEREIYHETRYLPGLELMSLYYCKTADTEVLNLFFTQLWADRGSASEAPSWVLAKCYVCHPNKVGNTIKDLSSNERVNILGQLEFGLANLGYWDKNTNSCNNQEYLKLLEELGLN